MPPHNVAEGIGMYKNLKVSKRVGAGILPEPTTSKLDCKYYEAVKYE